MNKIIVISLFLSVAAWAVNPTTDLRVNFSKVPAVIIPAPSTTLSCEEIATLKSGSGSIGAGYFSIPMPEMSWHGDQQLSEVRIEALVLKLNSKHTGEYKCVYSGSNLGSLFYKQSAVGDNLIVNFWDQRLGNVSNGGVLTTSDLTRQKFFNACDIKCGGLNLEYDVPKFSARGTWEVYAVNKQYESSLSTRFKEFPIKVKGNFTVRNVID